MPSGEEKWWLCSVVQATASHIGVQPPGYSMQEFGRQEGFEKVEDGSTQFFRLATSSPRLNTSRARKTSIQVDQAPFGCVWYSKWVAQVDVAESKGQRAVIVFKKDMTGVRASGDAGGLGFSQMKEVEFLQKKYPKYNDQLEGFDPAVGFKEIDATEFESENAMNRAQIYESATRGLIHKQRVDLAMADDSLVAIDQLLDALAYASHTRDGARSAAQYRYFNDAFVAATVRSSAGARTWASLRPLILSSKFPLIVWEPSPDSEDQFKFVHLSFQEFCCARHLVNQLQFAYTSPGDHYVASLEAEPEPDTGSLERQDASVFLEAFRSKALGGQVLLTAGRVATTVCLGTIGTRW